MRKTSWLMLVLAIVLLVAPAWSDDAEIKWVPLDWEHAALENGAALYAELCAVCHGLDGKGDGPAAPALKTPMPDLTTLAAERDGEFPSAELAQVVSGERGVSAHGNREMPIWGQAFRDVRPDWTRTARENFSQQRVHAIVDYLQSIQVEEEGAESADEPSAIE